ncbi:hypothetical protein GGS23DRAFT_279446 [Durotheca rogersii]|uniref:uncharacterized protein n=1 Tax=Durotheca rogersii TaxID=419775 RepID=UPI00221FD5F6|nr:uncharacterized protein GGS23DRAFT_279446 [Durotheca rogersii]KAI5866614.1 hypothetical protein GGS23DRAFT_279446 [Durotheca rogersii]
MADAGYFLQSPQHPRPRPAASNPKFDRIDIWRTEVNRARKYCVCSAATASGFGSNRVSKDAPPLSSSSTAVGSDSRTELSQHHIALSHPAASNDSSDNHPESAPSAQSARRPLASSEAPRSKTSTPDTGRSDNQNPNICAVCSSRVDTEVSYLPLTEDGSSGFVRTNRGPRSVASIKKLKEAVSSKNYKTPRSMRINRAIKAPFKHLKNVALPPDRTSKRRRIVSKLFGNASGYASSSDDEQKPRPRATEMYYLLRPDVDPGSVETLAGLSDDDDDERRKPGLTIDQTASRLQRALKLLEKNGNTLGTDRPGPEIQSRGDVIRKIPRERLHTNEQEPVHRS